MAKVERNEFHDGRVVLFAGDARDALKEIPDNSIDSVPTDPPYALVSIVKRFANSPRNERTENTENPYGRTGRGFMGQRWDTGEVAFDPDFWREVFRVVKPGGHVAAFGGTRTYHRLAVAIEDAGFEIRDAAEFLHESDSELIGFLDSLTDEQRLQFVKLFAERGDGAALWTYGSGFPKSHDVSKGIDKRKDWAAVGALADAIRTARKALGISQTEAARRVGLIGPDETLGGGGFMWFETGRIPTRDEFPKLKAALDLGESFDATFEAAEREVVGAHAKGSSPGGFGDLRFAFNSQDITAPATDAARQWQGWGTALKPACEIICLARKPLSEGTVAANVLRWGTGAINVDACRVEAEANRYAPGDHGIEGRTRISGYALSAGTVNDLGRFPANLVHDGSPEVLAGFPDSVSTGGDGYKNSMFCGGKQTGGHGLGDSGSAARFFYTAKADAHGRVGSKHPTVKPVDLMQWLVRLITPRGGVTLDPFAGSGTTGEAALLEGFRAILCEREPQYQDDIAQRMAHVFSGKVGRSHVVNKDKAARAEPLPLFGSSPAPSTESE